MNKNFIVHALLLLLALPFYLLTEPSPSQTPENEISESQFSPAGLPIINLSIYGKSVTAEVANIDTTRRKGLFFRESLGKDNGMLFVFGASAPQTFWQKDARIPLSIAFMDDKGVILNIVDEMKPFTQTLYSSQGSAKFVLEMNSDWFKTVGIKPGATIPDVLKAPSDPAKEMEKFIDTQYLKPTFSGTPLLVHIYQNGGVVVKDGEKLVAMVEGDFSFPGEKIDKHIFFDEGHSRNLNDLESCANVGDGSKALLSGSLKKILNGFEIPEFRK